MKEPENVGKTTNPVEDSVNNDRNSKANVIANINTPNGLDRARNIIDKLDKKNALDIPKSAMEIFRRADDEAAKPAAITILKGVPDDVYNRVIGVDTKDNNATNKNNNNVAATPKKQDVTNTPKDTTDNVQKQPVQSNNPNTKIPTGGKNENTQSTKNAESSTNSKAETGTEAGRDTHQPGRLNSDGTSTKTESPETGTKQTDKNEVAHELEKKGSPLFKDDGGSVDKDSEDKTNVEDDDINEDDFIDDDISEDDLMGELASFNTTSNFATVIDGVTYYCLKNENGKVVKPKDFPRVDLSEF